MFTMLYLFHAAILEIHQGSSFLDVLFKNLLRRYRKYLIFYSTKIYFHIHFAKFISRFYMHTGFGELNIFINYVT